MDTKPSKGTGRADERTSHGVAPADGTDAYVRALRAGLSSEDARVVDEGPGASVDLGPELRFARSRLNRTARLLDELDAGKGEGHDLGQRGTVTRESLSEWLAYWTDRVRMIATARAEISPGADVRGTFRVIVTIRKKTG